MTIDISSWMMLIFSTAITFGLYSVLSGIDNPWFAWAEHTYLGAGTGLMVILALDYLNSKIITRITSNPLSNWPLIISLILGMLILTRTNQRTAHIARIPIAVATGTGIAVSTRALIFTNVIKQIKATIIPIMTEGDPMATFTNIGVIILVITMMSFFIYTTELRGPLKASSTFGRYALYAAFGALFAMTYQGRLGLFLGRMETMLIPNTHLYVSLIIAIAIVLTIYILHKYYPDTLKKIVP
jgi:hypothetical protein